jgi:hypothetical protein
MIRPKLNMFETIARNYLADALKSFRDYKKLADKALAQVSDEAFFRALDDESNSIAVIVKHLAGNMLSRWTDFLTTDGEKPTRQRDMEFVITPETTRAAMLDFCERGWACVFAAIEPLQPQDLARTVTIRGQAHTVLEAINRQLTHYSSHVGQIILLAKHWRGTEWQTLSVPRNRSAEFNQYLGDKLASGGNPGRHEAVQDFAESDIK